MKKNHSSFILIISLLLGIIVGLTFKDKIMFLKPIGNIFLNLMYTVVVPLIFFTISSSVAKMTNFKRLNKIIKNTLFVFIISSILSGLLMIITLKIFNPVTTSIALSSTNIESIDIFEKISGMFTVTDFNLLLSKSNILPLIIFAILFGLAVSIVQNKQVTDLLDGLSNVTLKLVSIIMLIAPIGLFSYFAILANTLGSTILLGYLKSFIIYCLVCIFYFFAFYSLYIYIFRGKDKVKEFYKKIIPVVLTSFATQSSLATLPTSINTCKNLGIKDDVSNITLSLGSTMHMEGSSMGAILKIIFLFGIFNIPFIGTSNFLYAILVALLSSIVMAGIPQGGLIGEMLIVSLYGFGASAFPIIATIGIIIDAPATTINAVGDVVSALIVEKIT